MLARLILVSVVVLAVGGCSRKEDAKPKRMLDEDEQKRVQAILASELPDWEKGEQLVPFIKPGMKGDEVHAILGEPTSFSAGGGIVSAKYRYDVEVTSTMRGRVIGCETIPPPAVGTPIMTLPFEDTSLEINERLRAEFENGASAAEQQSAPREP